MRTVSLDISPLIYFQEADALKKQGNEIPADALKALARCLYPAIRSYFESGEGKCEYAEWQSQRDTENLSGEIAA